MDGQWRSELPPPPRGLGPAGSVQSIEVLLGEVALRCIGNDSGKPRRHSSPEWPSAPTGKPGKASGVQRAALGCRGIGDRDLAVVAAERKRLSRSGIVELSPMRLLLTGPPSWPQVSLLGQRDRRGSQSKTRSDQPRWAIRAPGRRKSTRVCPRSRGRRCTQPRSETPTSTSAADSPLERCILVGQGQP